MSRRVPGEAILVDGADTHGGSSRPPLAMAGCCRMRLGHVGTSTEKSLRPVRTAESREADAIRHVRSEPLLGKPVQGAHLSWPGSLGHDGMQIADLRRRRAYSSSHTWLCLIDLGYLRREMGTCLQGESGLKRFPRKRFLEYYRNEQTADQAAGRVLDSAVPLPTPPTFGWETGSHPYRPSAMKPTCNEDGEGHMDTRPAGLAFCR